LPDKEEIKTDICIVCAGTAGIALARKFKDREFRA
jgi:cation diffusion facilitator CzcD-associated flavoprotein CzcO